MPQMSPLFWLNLFLLFMLSLMLFLTINYFMNQKKKKHPPLHNPLTFTKSWKW
uniref:ATP synthase F0 subunit 8 n=1 Tax=Engaewa walpolea TaxID=552823 RepID=A0A120HTV6_9EUCA|nr:ATP synthase F0 subunit 8 [Engaewa walpolea]AMA98211.1 ATP synthase F0 subunit 8 [Engaewa walpolea]